MSTVKKEKKSDFNEFVLGSTYKDKDAEEKNLLKNLLVLQKTASMDVKVCKLNMIGT